MRKDLFIVFLVVMAIIIINATSMVQLYNPTFSSYTPTQLTISSITATGHTYNANTMSAKIYNPIATTIYVSSHSAVSATNGWPILTTTREDVNGVNDRPTGTHYYKIMPGATETGTIVILERIK